GMSMDQRGVVVDEVEPLLALGIDDHRSLAAYGVGWIGVLVEGGPGVPARHHPRGSREELRRLGGAFPEGLAPGGIGDHRSSAFRVAVYHRIPRGTRHPWMP